MALGSASGSTGGGWPSDRQQPDAVACDDQILHQFQAVDLVGDARDESGQ
jgi:hypothetical protein